VLRSIAREDWPPEWTTIYYKTYPQLEKIALPEAHPHADLFEVVRRRGSGREFDSSPLSLEQLSILLKYSCGIVGEGGTASYGESPKQNIRAQPSAGARFPIEVYPIVFSGTSDLPAGSYHYNVKSHSLDVLLQQTFTPEAIGKLISYDFVKKASCVIILTAVFYRNQMKYGERGYRYALLEAGHIGQNLYLASGALGLQCCAMGGTQDEEVEAFLGIDGVSESVVYAIVIG
jgi:SagB-type dehydrogenase family enzyme